MNKDLLKKLNYIDHSLEDLSEIEKESIESKVDKNFYYIKNNEDLRIETFIKLKEKTNKALEEDEEIVYQGIFYLGMMGEKNFRYTVQIAIPNTVYYGLFISNKRVFIYRLTQSYKIIGENEDNIKGEYVNYIDNIEGMYDGGEFSDTLSIKFKDNKQFDFRPINNINRELLMKTFKGLEELSSKGVKIEKANSFDEEVSKRNYTIIYLVIFSLIMLLLTYKK